jgi:hypothetical protein
MAAARSVTDYAVRNIFTVNQDPGVTVPPRRQAARVQFTEVSVQHRAGPSAVATSSFVTLGGAASMPTGGRRYCPLGMARPSQSHCAVQNT